MLMLRTIELSEQEIRHMRLSAQHLLKGTKSEYSNVAQLLQTICGVQAQYPFDANLAMRVRMNNLTLEELGKAQLDERIIVRTWCMRGTLHLLAADDFYWLMDLHGKAFIKKSQHRYKDLGLDDTLYGKCIEKLYTLLEENAPLTREEVKDYFMTQDINLEGQASYHLLRRAALEGLVCFGPDRNSEPTYVLVDKWLGVKHNPLSKEEALERLARRYLEAYGPASFEDFVKWSGISKADLRQGWKNISSEMVEVKSAGQSLYVLENQLSSKVSKVLNSPTDFVHLVPAYDPYLLGYSDRKIILLQDALKDVYPGGGLLRSALLLDGVISSSWEIKRYQKRIEIRLKALREIEESVQDELRIEVQNLSKFLGIDAEFVIL